MPSGGVTQSCMRIGGPTFEARMTEPRSLRSGVEFLGREHLEGSKRLTFDDLTVHSYNILNTAQNFQVVTVPSTPKTAT